MSSQTKRPTILVVDDDELIVTSLRGLFLLETGYEVLEFRDPLKAVEEVERRAVDLVISDFLMPQMNGVDLLKKVRELQPDAVRILLTGFADKENAIRAINEVGLYRYIEKPWDNQDLLLSIRNALGERNLRRQLAERVEELSTLINEHRALSDRHRSLERELEMAARVHQSLLPEAMPEIEGFRCATFYESCAALGGDYYDYAHTSNGTQILVSDVSGHGVQAALSSMLLKAIFQEAAARAEGPVELLAAMNARLHKFLPSGMYACAAALFFAPGSGKVRFANAGLPYPFLLAAEPRRVDELPLSGLPLGLFDTSGPESYDQRELEMSSQDVLLVASDGLGDIRGSGDGQFQDAALRQALDQLHGGDGTAVIEGLVERAKGYAAGRGYPDDVSLLTITKL